MYICLYLLQKNSKIKGLFFTVNIFQIAICPHSQFDYEFAETHGFGGMSDFLAGNRKDLTDGLTWKINGRSSQKAPYNNLNLRSKNISLKIKVGNTDLVDYVGNTTEFVHKTNDSSREFFWNHGSCYIINTAKDVNEVTIATNIPFQVYMIDPKINMLDTRSQMGEVLGAYNVQGLAK